jgi:hypothetical protein
MPDKNCDEEIRALLEIIKILTQMLLDQVTPPKAPVIKSIETFLCK